jgi:hypothetical protein
MLEQRRAGGYAAAKLGIRKWSVKSSITVRLGARVLRTAVGFADFKKNYRKNNRTPRRTPACL